MDKLITHKQFLKVGRSYVARRRMVVQVNTSRRKGICGGISCRYLTLIKHTVQIWCTRPTFKDNSLNGASTFTSLHLLPEICLVATTANVP